MWRTGLMFAATLAVVSCREGSLNLAPEESLTTSFISAGSPGERAVLAVVNDTAVTRAVLDDDVGLDRRAAENIDVQRSGSDGLFGTEDDQLFDSIAALDSVPYVGPTALDALLDYAAAHGYVEPDEISDVEARERAMLAVVNDPAVTFAVLDDDVGLDRRAAENICSHRAGPDQIDGTADDQRFDTLAELDGVPYVGESALNAILEYALANGYLEPVTPVLADVIFSPQLYDASHTARVRELIAAAEHTIDVAMYSFSDSATYNALGDAVARGVNVRFIFETANADRRLTGSELEGSDSADLERMGINVRYVNKIMHHKYAIFDGPRDLLDRAATATLATGSGNWSYGAATRYDENTLFLSGHPKLALRLQQQFNLMWEHSRDFVFDDSLPYEMSGLTVTEDLIPDQPNADVLFTSENFTVSDTTFRIKSNSNHVSDALVAAIDGATQSIRVASGHLRSRPVAEALMRKHELDPNVDIRVYLDGQEYISAYYHNEQQAELEDCLVEAGDSEAKIRDCYDTGFYFGYQVSLTGIQVRYKYYAYRWHYTYAVQMHHKYLIIDDQQLWTGSYNLSDNAEHNTFENIFCLDGPELSSLVARYADNFDTIWNISRDDGTYGELIDTVETSDVIPLVFTPMALTWSEVTELKDVIYDNCADINSEPYRTEPENHTVCYR